ncbi:MAG: PHP domain-containing protein [Clostridiales Family XIII bacterium]|jgi:predicted metal-dependent phosphoesterase TrpH|nr:PHP domain-containing protein [Clostridiales Family XIII bacterium]
MNSHVDLHLHTNRSDGQYPPAEVVRLAQEASVSLISVTDHDTVAGIAEAESEAVRCNIRFIAGIEISTKSEHEQHILGYFIDPQNSHLQKMCAHFIALRHERANRILSYLEEKGIHLSLSEIRENTYGDYIGRPHIAEAMLKRGLVQSRQDAFERYLTTPEFRKIERPKPMPEEGIETIRHAGGVAVLAHPHSLRLTGAELEKAVGNLKTLGLGGMECYYPDYSEELVQEYKKIAERYDLIVTGGSDFHGPAVKPNVQIGQMRDGSSISFDESVYEKLERARGF